MTTKTVLAAALALSVGLARAGTDTYTIDRNHTTYSHTVKGTRLTIGSIEYKVAVPSGWKANVTLTRTKEYRYHCQEGVLRSEVNYIEIDNIFGKDHSFTSGGRISLSAYASKPEVSAVATLYPLSYYYYTDYYYFVSYTITAKYTQTVQPPGPPSGLTLSQTDEGVLLGWPAVDGASAYRLQRQENDSTTWTTLVSSQTATTFLDSSVERGGAYRYRVAAGNTGGWSTWAAASDAVIFAPTRITVTFDACGGEAALDKVTCEMGGKIGMLPGAERVGYEFVGWFTEKEGGEPVTDTTPVPETSFTAYARWKLVEQALSDALSGSGLAFATGGAAGWFAQTAKPHDGGPSARSGRISDGESTLSASVAGAGYVSFDWAVSSDADTGTFSFAVDGVSRLSHGGLLGDWRTARFPVRGDVVHFLEWKYARNAGTAAGEDCAWVAGVRWESVQSPAVPSVTASRDDANGVRLDWAADPAAEAFLVYRSLPEGGEELIATVATNSYFDAAALPGVSRDYRVVASNIAACVSGGAVIGSRVAVLGTDADFLTIPPLGGKASLSLSANGAWAAATDAEWLGLSAGSGTGDAVLSLSASRNDAHAMRMAAIVFSLGEMLHVVHVVQYPVEFAIDSGALRIDTKSDGGTPTFTTPDGVTLEGRVEDGIAVFEFDNLEIGSGATVEVSGRRPLKLYAYHDMAIAADIDISGSVAGRCGGGIGGTGGAGGSGGAGGTSGSEEWLGSGGNGGTETRNGFYLYNNDWGTKSYYDASAGQPGGGGISGAPGSGGMAGNDGNNASTAFGASSIASGGRRGSAGIGGMGGDGGSGGTGGEVRTAGSGSNCRGTDGSIGGSGGKGGHGSNGDKGEDGSNDMSGALSSKLLMAGAGGAGGGGGGGGAGGGEGGGGGGGGAGGGVDRSFDESVIARFEEYFADPNNGRSGLVQFGNGSGGRYGGNGGDGGNGGSGTYGGTGGNGGGALIFAARGCLELSGKIDISAGTAGMGGTMPGLGSSGSRGSDGGNPMDGGSTGFACLGALPQDRLSHNYIQGPDGRIYYAYESLPGNKGGSGGGGGSGGSGGSGGDGGRGGNGGCGAPGMVKLCASLIVADGARIVADNGNGDTADNRCGGITYASNMSGDSLAARKPSFSHRTLEGKMRHDALLKTASIFDPSLSVPVLGQFKDGISGASGICADGNFAWRLASDGVAELSRGGLSVYRLPGLFEGYDQIFVRNDGSSTLSAVRFVAGSRACAIPELAPREVWTTCVVAGMAVSAAMSATIPEIGADASPEAVNAAIAEAGFADAEALMDAVGGNPEKYAAFKAWAQGVKDADGGVAGDSAVMASPYAAVSWLLGAGTLFRTPPLVTISELRRNESPEVDGASAFTVAVTVKDGSDVADVSSTKLAAMFEATGKLGDWDGGASIRPTVTDLTGRNDSTLRFSVIPGEIDTASPVFLRVKVK